MFTREDISSLPVPDAKFHDAKSDYLGQLIITPEMVAKKIKAMKDNKSPGVDGIPPNLLMEWIPLARVFNVSLKKGVVLFLNEKKQTSYQYLKRVRELRQRITDKKYSRIRGHEVTLVKDQCRLDIT